jgi:hypothetical protein
MHEAQFHMTSLSEFTVGTVEVQSGVNSLWDSVSGIQGEQRALSQRVANLETLALTMTQQLSEIKEMIRQK